MQHKSKEANFIELKLREVTQLFNSMDPSPFHEKDLDHDAEEFIVSWAQEFPIKSSLELKIYLDQKIDSSVTQTLERAIHNYFAYRYKIKNREFKYLLRQARQTLLISMFFLAFCLVTGNLLENQSTGMWADIIHEGLTIAGWVALWKPIQLYLYDWWPVYHERNIYQKLSQIRIHVIQTELLNQSSETNS